MNGSGVGDDDLGHAEGASVGARVHAGRAAEGEEREAARIEAPLHRGSVQQVGEARVREPVHRRRRLDDIHAERACHELLERLVRRADVEPLTPPEEELRVQVAEDGVDVRDRRLAPAVSVTDGARVRAGAARADARGPRPRIERHDAPAGQAERDDVELRQRVVVAQHQRLSLILDPPLPDDADLERRPAHVGGDHVRRPDQLAEPLRADEARRRARLDHPHRSARGLLERQQPSVGLRNEQRAAEALLGESVGERLEVPADDGAEPRVQRDGGRALVLADHRCDLVRERQEDVRSQPPHGVGDRTLGRRIGERPQQADADRLDARLEQPLEGSFDLGGVRHDVLPAVRVGTLADPFDEPAVDDRRQLVLLDRVALLLLRQA